jgi:hypothetical protein
MKLDVFADPEKVTNVEAQVRELSKPDRLLRAGKGGGVFLLCAAAVLPIPVVHLIGVPISLMLAGFTAIRRGLQKIEIKESVIQCPSCGQKHTVNTYWAEWPLRLHCGQCRSQFLARPS